MSGYASSVPMKANHQRPHHHNHDDDNSTVTWAVTDSTGGVESQQRDTALTVATDMIQMQKDITESLSRMVLGLCRILDQRGSGGDGGGGGGGGGDTQQQQQRERRRQQQRTTTTTTTTQQQQGGRGGGGGGQLELCKDAVDSLVSRQEIYADSVQQMVAVLDEKLAKAEHEKRLLLGEVRRLERLLEKKNGTNAYPPVEEIVYSKTIETREYRIQTI